MGKKGTSQIYEHVTRSVDTETGELKTVEIKQRFKRSRDTFTMFYIEEVASLLIGISPSETKVLLAISAIAEYNTARVFLTKGVKTRIANDSGLAYGTVQNCISQLARKNILIRQETSEYILNPQYFFKGQEIERAQILRVILEFNMVDDESHTEPVSDA